MNKTGSSIDLINEASESKRRENNSTSAKMPSRVLAGDEELNSIYKNDPSLYKLQREKMQLANMDSSVSKTSQLHNLGELNSEDCLRKKLGRLQSSSNTENFNIMASAEDISGSGKLTPA